MCVVANAFIAAADAARARFVLANAAEVGLRPEVLPYLAVLKASGAAGLVVGLTGIAPFGLAGCGTGDVLPVCGRSARSGIGLPQHRVSGAVLGVGSERGHLLRDGRDLTRADEATFRFGSRWQADSLVSTSMRRSGTRRPALHR
ncbi:DoxX family protein [Naumannella huperziae]